MGLRFGVDTGGTFTDVCAYDDADGHVHVHKVSSTPDDPGRAIVRNMLVASLAMTTTYLLGTVFAG